LTVRITSTAKVPKNIVGEPVYGSNLSIGTFVPVLFGKETVGQLETVSEAVPELA
jgi:hypothetical protein